MVSSFSGTGIPGVVAKSALAPWKYPTNADIEDPGEKTKHAISSKLHDTTGAFLQRAIAALWTIARNFTSFTPTTTVRPGAAVQSPPQVRRVALKDSRNSSCSSPRARVYSPPRALLSHNIAINVIQRLRVVAAWFWSGVPCLRTCSAMVPRISL